MLDVFISVRLCLLVCVGHGSYQTFLLSLHLSNFSLVCSTFRRLCICESFLSLLQLISIGNQVSNFNTIGIPFTLSSTIPSAVCQVFYIYRCWMVRLTPFFIPEPLKSLYLVKSQSILPSARCHHPRPHRLRQRCSGISMQYSFIVNMNIHFE